MAHNRAINITGDAMTYVHSRRKHRHRSARRRKYNLIRDLIIAAVCLFAVATMIAILK